MNVVDIVAEVSATNTLVKYLTMGMVSLALGTLIYFVGKYFIKRHRSKQAGETVDKVDKTEAVSIAVFSVIGLMFLTIATYSISTMAQDPHIGRLLEDRISAEYNFQYTDNDHGSKRNDPASTLGKNFRHSVVGETFSTSEPIYVDGEVIVVHLVKETEDTVGFYYTNMKAYELKAFPRN